MLQAQLFIFFLQKVIVGWGPRSLDSLGFYPLEMLLRILSSRHRSDAPEEFLEFDVAKWSVKHSTKRAQILVATTQWSTDHFVVLNAFWIQHLAFWLRHVYMSSWQLGLTARAKFKHLHLQFCLHSGQHEGAKCISKVSQISNCYSFTTIKLRDIDGHDVTLGSMHPAIGWAQHKTAMAKKGQLCFFIVQVVVGGFPWLGTDLYHAGEPRAKMSDLLVDVCPQIDHPKSPYWYLLVQNEKIKTTSCNIVPFCQVNPVVSHGSSNAPFFHFWWFPVWTGGISVWFFQLTAVSSHASLHPSPFPCAMGSSRRGGAAHDGGAAWLDTGGGLLSRAAKKKDHFGTLVSSLVAWLTAASLLDE